MIFVGIKKLFGYCLKLANLWGNVSTMGNLVGPSLSVYTCMNFWILTIGGYREFWMRELYMWTDSNLVFCTALGTQIRAEQRRLYEIPQSSLDTASYIGHLCWQWDWREYGWVAKSKSIFKEYNRWFVCGVK